MPTAPAWEEFRNRWPNAAASRFVEAGGLRWHVQVLGAGPVLLLLHGAGGATHSWATLAPRLAERYTVVAPDLPGHGFTSRPAADGMTLDGMAHAVTALLDALPETRASTPLGFVGHSAGGALALHLAVTRPPRAVVGINAALTPPNALLAALTPAVGGLVRSRLVASLTALLAESDLAFDALMRSTGSRIDAEQLARYRAFARSPAHTGAVMSMFAGWALATLEDELPSLHLPVTLIVGDRDGWVLPGDAERTARRMPDARVVVVRGTGHLAHEEQPAQVAALISEALARVPGASS